VLRHDRQSLASGPARLNKQSFTSSGESFEGERMFQSNFVKNAARFGLLICCLSIIWRPVSAQGGENLQELKQKAEELLKKQQYTDALPLLEKLVAAEPENPQTHFHLGFALIGQANTLKDSAARKAARLRARSCFTKSKELGIKEPIVDALI
jgi:hypothetical protein